MQGFDGVYAISAGAARHLYNQACTKPTCQARLAPSHPNEASSHPCASQLLLLLQVFVDSGGGPIAGDFVSELCAGPSAAAVRVLSPVDPNPGALHPGEPLILAPVLAARPAASGSPAGDAGSCSSGPGSSDKGAWGTDSSTSNLGTASVAGQHPAFDPAKLRADVDELAAAARAQPARWQEAHIGPSAGLEIQSAPGWGRHAAAGPSKPDPTADGKHPGMEPGPGPAGFETGSGEGSRGERRKHALDELRALDARQQASGGPGEAVVLLVPGGGDVALRERSWQDAWLAGLARRKS